MVAVSQLQNNILWKRLYSLFSYFHLIQQRMQHWNLIWIPDTPNHSVPYTYILHLYHNLKAPAALLNSLISLKTPSGYAYCGDLSGGCRWFCPPCELGRLPSTWRDTWLQEVGRWHFQWRIHGTAKYLPAIYHELLPEFGLNIIPVPWILRDARILMFIAFSPFGAESLWRWSKVDISSWLKSPVR